ncbi:MAG: hypothetical protein HY841_13635 [Bacteroidetes bacterium]|nr:hypothetical protein [Bacteroidota bacterium]
MAKAKVKREFINLSVDAKIQFSRDRVVDMTGNANFTTPNPSLATVAAVNNDLETKHLAALGGGPMQTAAQNAAELVWNDTMGKLAVYVEITADGDVTKITSAGFHPTSTEKQPTHAPVKPANPNMKHSDNTGEIFFSCDAVPDAETYIALLSTDAAALDIAATKTQLMIELNPQSSTPVPIPMPPPVPVPASSVLLIIDVSSQRKKIITGLASGTRIHGKIYCTNSAGRGPDSDVISIMVA